MVPQGDWRFPQAAAEGDVISTESRPGLEGNAIETAPGVCEGCRSVHSSIYVASHMIMGVLSRDQLPRPRSTPM